MLSFGIDTGPRSFCHLFIVVPMICCSKLAQKSAVQVCQIATAVVVVTIQVVVSEFENFYHSQVRIE